jgi:hypothetical protein
MVEPTKPPTEKHLDPTDEDDDDHGPDQHD